MSAATDATGLRDHMCAHGIGRQLDAAQGAGSPSRDHNVASRDTCGPRGLHAGTLVTPENTFACGKLTRAVQRTVRDVS